MASQHEEIPPKGHVAALSPVDFQAYQVAYYSEFLCTLYHRATTLKLMYLDDAADLTVQLIFDTIDLVRTHFPRALVEEVKLTPAYNHIGACTFLPEMFPLPESITALEARIEEQFFFLPKIVEEMKNEGVAHAG